MTILVRNGQVIDGSGKSPFRSDVFVSGKKISALGIFPNKKADIVIDAGGGFITPGFIDVHNTSDHFLSFHSGFDPGNLFSQGVTTVIGGNCGVSLAPFSRAGSVLLGSYSRSGMNADWRDVDELFNHFRKRPLGVNFATLIGYETFRRGVNFPSRPNKKFLSGLLPRISGLLSQGAAGISFGLSHSRNSKFSLPELLLLANSCAGKSRVLSGCLSVPEGDIAFETEEFIGVAGKHGLRGLITEFMPRMGMGSYERALEILEKLPPEGNIRFQCHPFDSSSYEIAEFLPDWVRKEPDHILEKLEDEWMLKKIAKEMRHLRAEDLIVGQAPDHGFLTGISLKDFAEAHSIREPSFALLKLAQTTELRCLLFYRDIDERLLKRSLGSERSLIGSTVPDVAWGSWRPERMGYQAPLLAFSRFLELSSQGLMPMENAIKKITSVPARFFQMTGRGEIKEGFFADIAVFPMESFRHASDLIINGRMVMRGGEIIDRKAGRPIIIETGL